MRSWKRGTVGLTGTAWNCTSLFCAGRISSWTVSQSVDVADLSRVSANGDPTCRAGNRFRFFRSCPCGSRCSTPSPGGWKATLHTMIIWGIECQPLRHVQHDTAYVQTCVDLVLCSPLCGIFVFSHLKALKRAHRLCRSGAGSVHRGGNI